MLHILNVNCIYYTSKGEYRKIASGKYIVIYLDVEKE